jgi:hypothetical protein
LGCCGQLISDLLHVGSERGNLALKRSLPAVNNIHADTEQ